MSIFTASRFSPVHRFVFQKGQDAHHIYVILSGEVDVRTHENGDQSVLETMTPGSIFGEGAILQQREKRSRSVRARVAGGGCTTFAATTNSTTDPSCATDRALFSAQVAVCEGDLRSDQDRESAIRGGAV